MLGWTRGPARDHLICIQVGVPCLLRVGRGSVLCFVYLHVPAMPFMSSVLLGNLLASVLQFPHLSMGAETVPTLKSHGEDLDEVT